MANKATIGAKIVLDGEQEYKRALTDVGKSMQNLRSESKLSDAQFKENKNSIEALASKHDILKRQYEEQKRRITLMNSALDDAKTKFGENSAKVTDWKTKLNNAHASLFDMDNELKLNEKRLDEAKASTNGCATSIDKFGKEVKIAEGKTSVFGDVLKANLTSTAIIGGVQMMASNIKSLANNLVGLATDSAKYADDMLTMSTQTGVATDKLQAYNYMAELTDTSMETMTKSMAKNIKSMANAKNGSEKFVDAYKALNVEYEDGNKKLLDGETVYWNVIDALGEMTDETERDAISMQLFGKSAQELNTLIVQGSAGVKKMTDEAKSMGAVLDRDTLNSLGSTDDALQRMSQSIEIAKRRFGAEMAPEFERAANKITQKSGEMSEKFADFAGNAMTAVIDGFLWIIDHGAEIVSVITGISTGLIMYKAVTGIIAVVEAMKTLKTVTETAAVAQTALNTAQGLNPYALIAAGVIGIGTALYTYISSMEDTETELDKLNAKIDDNKEKIEQTKKALEDTKKEYSDNTTEVKESAKYMKELTDKLYKLNEKEKLSNIDKAEMTSLIKTLNEKYPELGLVIDSVTGKLNLEKAAINETIDATKKKLLAQESEKAYAGYAKAVVDGRIAEMEASKNLEEQTRKLKEAEVAEAKAKQAMKDNESDFTGTIVDLDLAITSAHEDVLKYTSFVEDGTETQKQAVQTTKDAEAEYDSFSKILGSTATTIEDGNGKIADSADGMATTTANSVDAVKKAYGDAEKACEDAEKAYDDAYESAKSSLEGQTGIFEAFAKGTAVSKETLMKNLNSQIKGIRDWKTNILKIAETASPEFVQYLADMGIGASAEIEALAGMTETELKKYEKTWKKYNKAVEEGTTESVKRTTAAVAKEQAEIEKTHSAMSKQQSTFAQKSEDEYHKHSIIIPSVIAKGIEEKKKLVHDTLWNESTAWAKLVSDNLNGKKTGSDYVDGIGEGANDKKSELYKTLSTISLGMITATKNPLEIKSPSRVARREVGSMWTEGVALGVTDGLDKVRYATSKIKTSLTSGMQGTLAKTPDATPLIDYNRLGRAFAEEFQNVSVELDSQKVGAFVDTRLRRGYV